MVIPAAVGALLILIGIALLIVDLGVTNHGLPAAVGVVMMLAGGSALLWAGVPYSGVLLGAIVAVAALLGGACSSGFWALRAPSKGGGPSPARRG
jgi:membrane-bound ClpP family serine protease